MNFSFAVFIQVILSSNFITFPSDPILKKKALQTGQYKYLPLLVSFSLTKFSAPHFSQMTFIICSSLFLLCSYLWARRELNPHDVAITGF